eukprot:9242655-Pyramimonas_sp.AAC.1
MDCIMNDDWASQSACDDCVITHAPDIAQSGCFPQWKWMSLPPCDQIRYGPDLLAQEWLGDPTFLSKDITTMLRHANHKKPFHIDKLTDRRVNRWSMKAQQSWAIPSRWKYFQE